MGEDTIQIIRKITWSYVRSNPGMEFEELFSEACVAYLSAASRYIPEKSKRSTFIWRVVSNHLNNLLLKKRRTRAPILKQNEAEVSSPEQIYLAKERWQEILSNLSPSAQYICNIVVNGTDYLPLDKPRKSRGQIAHTLQQQGWTGAQVWATFREIKNAVQQ